MKVGTDGVLLGAWSRVEGMQRILDVGTGCGLIALMMAQRSSDAKITAIDIDISSAEQAKENVMNSSFCGRIEVKTLSLQQYAATKPAALDLIVSNPPFFSDSILPPDQRRSGARHSVTLTLDNLLHLSASCLATDGVLSIILPYDKMEDLERLRVTHNYYLKRQTSVYPLPDREPKRFLAELTLTPVDMPEITSLTIESSRHCYTGEFTHLVKDFYL